MDNKRGLGVIAIVVIIVAVVALVVGVSVIGGNSSDGVTGFVSKGGGSAYCDENDGGNNLYVKGVTNSSGSKYNDVCYGGGSGIRENWCNGNTSKTDVFDCKSLGNYVCSDGACIPKDIVAYWKFDGGT